MHLQTHSLLRDRRVLLPPVTSQVIESEKPYLTPHDDLTDAGHDIRLTKRMISSFRIQGMDAGAHRACMNLTKSLRLRCWELGAAGRLLPSPAADADCSSVCHPLQDRPPSVPAYLSLVRILILCPRATEFCYLLVLGHIVQLPP
jgi:hypothetical protein